jgi:hypothetical protein
VANVLPKNVSAYLIIGGAGFPPGRARGHRAGQTRETRDARRAANMHGMPPGTEITSDNLTSPACKQDRDQRRSLERTRRRHPR